MGKHGYRIEQRHFATGGESHGNLRADVYTSKRKLRRFLSPERKNPIANFDLAHVTRTHIHIDTHTRL